MDEAHEDEGGPVGSGLVVAASGADADAAQDESAAQEERVSRRTILAVHTLSSTFVLTAIALLLSEPLHKAEPIRLIIPQPAMFVILCVMYAAASWFPVQFHYQGNTYLFVLEEVPMLLGLVFLSPTLLVLAAVCAEIFVRVGPRRQAFYKAFFNVASCAASIALAALVYREVLGTSSPVSSWGWLAASAGLCTSMISTTLMARVVLKVIGQTSERRTAVQFTTEAMFMAANMCLSFVVLDLAWFSLWAIIPLVLVAVLIIGAYNGYARLTLRFASLQRLYDFSRTIGTASLEPPSMSEDVLRQVCTVMRARRAELILREPSGMARRISIDEGETSGFEPVSLEESSIVADAVASGSATIHHGEGQGKRQIDPISGSYNHAVVAPIMNGRSAIGAIAAFDRYEELDEFDDDDLRLFETLVAHASASLERSRLVEELRFDIGDLNSRRGRITGQDQRGNAEVINAMVPLANMFGYVNTLRSMSQGRAQYSMTFDHYEQVPQAVADEVRAKLA